jgi:hypothetical protein
MANEESTQPEEELEADGYYGDDDADDEEIDLSFLDEEDEDEKPVR